MKQKRSWIRPAEDMGDIVPEFLGVFRPQDKAVESAQLSITGMGVYAAKLNDRRVGDFILAPGWTVYEKRLQYQSYDIAGLLRRGEENRLSVLLGKGWYRGRLVGWQGSAVQESRRSMPAGLWACVRIDYEDGSFDEFCTDETWRVRESRVRLSEIYDGEIYDASLTLTGAAEAEPAVVFDGPDDTLIEQEGEEIREQEQLTVRRIITTPKGEKVLDFGQEITGYVRISLTAENGDAVDLSFGEMLDAEGNFYRDNYRSARAQYRYICRGGQQEYQTLLTFYGFRYVRVNAFPGGPAAAKPENFTGIVIHSDMERIGELVTGCAPLNRLVSNAVWSQKCNFVDVPTDCPQRDERLGWTGDAQVFIRTACYNYDAECFYGKWLADLAADQREDGAVPHVSPDLLRAERPSAAWGDAMTICPWEVYQAYGNAEILSRFFDNMKRWVDYITGATAKSGLWAGGEHYGDWLGLDAPAGSYKGSSREELIATAFYARSTELVVKAARVLQKAPELIREYEQLWQRIRAAFQEAYPVYETQTECCVAVEFGLAADLQGTADQLARMVREVGVQLRTGFVGTPYLLRVLSRYGYCDLAYSLLLRREYPSWLYPVEHGATTIWEHWDGVMEDGGFWSTDMNSFNHYAYGAVLDWLYGEAAGIRTAETAPGYERAVIEPHPDERLGFLKGRLMTARGEIVSEWEYVRDTTESEPAVRYVITTPVPATIVIDGTTYERGPGSYLFFRDAAAGRI